MGTDATPTWQPEAPDWAERVRESFGRQGLMAHLGARLAEVAPGRVAITVDHAPELTQQHGFFHAGVTSAIADSAGGYAGFTLFPADSSVLTVEYKMNLLAPARGPRLLAVGEVVRAGRTMTFCDLKVWNIDGDDRSLCATGQQTLIRLAGRPDGGGTAPPPPAGAAAKPTAGRRS